jgi:hypothetical protein
VREDLRNIAIIAHGQCAVNLVIPVQPDAPPVLDAVATSWLAAAECEIIASCVL